jgi:hypothetical protein
VIEGKGGVEKFSFAANDDHVLVAAYSAPDESGTMDVVTWVVDPVRGTSATNSFRIAATARQDAGLLDRPSVAWAKGRWILIAYEDVAGPEGDESRNTLWTSSDGLAWSRADLPQGMGGVYSIATGPRGVAAATCTFGPGADGSDPEGIWYSTDGLGWARVPGWAPGHQTPVIGVGEYGFAIRGGESGVELSTEDGSEVYRMAGPFNDVGAAASSDNTLLIHALHRGQLWLYSPQ